MHANNGKNAKREASFDRRAALQAMGALGGCLLLDCAERRPIMNSEKPTKVTGNRMHEVMVGHVERGELPGLVTAISRRGDMQVDVIGTKAVGSADPMGRDTIFRISSMSKPITAAAAMVLVEEGKLRLDESVDRLLPELANRRVLKRLDGPLDDTVPAKRPITLLDLLTFRMGFGIIWGPQDAHPIQKAANELQLVAFGPPKPLITPPPDEWIRRFGTLPLMHQPGEKWMYNTGSEVLSVLIARASGQPLDVFFHERIFGPLGMKDTSFSVPASKLDRLAMSYMVNFKSGALDLYDSVKGSDWSKPPAFPSGASGLVSTIDDYLAFGQMMLSRGTHGGRRILSESSVHAMATDQLTPEQKAASGAMPTDYWKNHGWGFGMAVVTAADEFTTVPGRFGWDGGLGTSWCSDPSQDMVAILMTQRSEFPAFSPVYCDFWKTAYQGTRT
jgi:CubicO group peptidase (beta-lactamase class C family)